MKNKRNLQISLSIAIIFLLSTVIYTFLDTEDAKIDSPVVNREQNINENTDSSHSVSIDQKTIIPPENHREFANEVPENKIPFQDNTIPPDLLEQAKNPSPELPDDLKEQVENQDGKNELPEDIKRSLAIPSRQVSIDEVNNPHSN